MKRIKKEPGFTLIELLIVIAIIVILSVILLPKIQYSTDKARRSGVEKNKQYVSSLARNIYEKSYDSSVDNNDRVQQTYTKLSKMNDIANLKNPLDTNKTGIGYIDGSKYNNSNKAVYILTSPPTEDTFPDGTILVYLANNLEVAEGTNSELLHKEQYYFEDTTYKNIMSAGTYTLLRTSSGIYGTGNRAYTPVTSTKPAYIMSSANVKDICTYTETYIIDGNNLLVSGYNNYGEIAPATSTGVVNKVMVTDNITNVYGVHECNIIRKANGDYYAIGYNEKGQFGLGNYTNKSSYVKLPVDVTDKLYVGGMHTIALKTDGTVYGAGSNANGELGLGSVTTTNVYTKLPIDDVIKVYTFAYTTVFLKSDGSLYYTGSVTGMKVNTPTKLNISNVKHISLGVGFIVVQTKDNELYAIGDNAYKQFGIGSSANTTYTDFVNITPVDQSTSNKVEVSEFYAASRSIFVIDNKGVLYVAGQNNGAQLGLGDMIDRPTWTINPFITFN